MLVALCLAAEVLMEQPEPGLQCCGSRLPLICVTPREAGLRARLPVENTDQLPTCSELCPLLSLPLAFTYRVWW